MAYSTIADSEIDPESPGTNTLFTKLRDNPEAIATGLPGATKIVLGALDAAAKPGLTLLDTQTAATSAFLTFNTGIDSTYERYIFELFKIVTASGTSNLTLQGSTDTGSTWLAGTNYDYMSDSVNSAGTREVFSGAGQSEMGIYQDASSTNTLGLSGTIEVYSPSDTTAYKNVVHNITGYDFGTSSHKRAYGGGVIKTSTAIDAIRIYFSGVNMTSGIIRMYGVKK